MAGQLLAVDPILIEGNSIGLAGSGGNFFNGTFVEPFDALVTSDGSTITMSLEQSGGGDLTMQFSDSMSALDCTPAQTIELTAGASDTVPQGNFIFIPQSTRVLTKSTSDWPAAEHIRVGYFYVQSASLVNTGASGNNWALIAHNHNDEGMGTDKQGHMSHMSERSRRLGAIWKSGCEGVATQDGNDLWVSVATGVLYQMHKHTFSALDSDTAGAGDKIVVVNDPDAAFAQINSLNSITKMSDGDLIGNNKYVKLALWIVINKSGEVSPMMLNLPDEFYNTQAEAERDVDGHANFTIPDEFGNESSTGALIAAFVCKHTATAMQIQSTQDLRGQTPTTVAGSGTGGGDVTAAAVLTDNALIRGDGGAKGIQDSGWLLDDNDDMLVPGNAGVFFGDTNTGIVAVAGSMVLGVAAGKQFNFVIDGAGEVGILADQMILSQAGPFVGFGWGTTSELDVEINNAAQVTFTDGTFEPATDNDIDFGIPSKKFKDAYFAGAITAAEIANTSGDLKIMPDVQGDVILFGDTDVNDATDGKELRIWRKAAEGDDYLRFYVNAAQQAMIHSNSNLVMQVASGKWIRLTSKDDIFLGLGDNAGANKLRVRDSDSVTVATIASDGLIAGVRLESTVASGTAPLKVSSDTVVPDLNSDMVDGRNEDEFALLAGRSGGQTLIGGTASGDNLTLQSTSDATKGYVMLGGMNGVVFDEENGRLAIGSDEFEATIGGVTKGSSFTIHGQGGADAYDVTFHRHSATSGTFLAGLRSRGSEASPTIVQDGDNLFDLFGAGWDGTDYEFAAAIHFDADGTPGNNDMPGRIVFLTTPDGSTTLTEAFRIKQDQNMLAAGTGKLQFLDDDQYIHSSAANTLDLSGGTRLNLRIAGDIEAYVDANKLTFDQAFNSVGLNWATASELDVEINGTPKATFTSGTFEPVTTNDIDLGTASEKFKDAYFAGDVLASTFESDIATGTAPFIVASETQVANLMSTDSDKVDGKHVGTSGNTIPLLDGTNTFSANQLINSTNQLQFRDSGNYIDSFTTNFLRINGVSAIAFSVGGTAKATLSSAGLDVVNVLRAEGLRADGDPGGASGTTTLTNVTLGAGSSAPIVIDVPTGYAATQDTYLKFYVGTVEYVVPAYVKT